MTEDQLREPELLSREDLKVLAIDMLAGLVFTDRHIKQIDAHMLGSVFMVAGLGGLTGWNAEKIGLVYQYMDRAGPRSVNGYPIFMSMRMLHIDQMDELKALVKSLMEAIDKV
jgi:hypothetical protein